jgi:glycosyltransferase involved in cell wall biosynthesis
MKSVEKPMVSIVIPTYNMRHDFFEECLKSALAQTYSNFEVVISNNHSTNNIEAVLERFNDDRIRVYKPLKHLPLVPNFAFAASKAHGEYISFLSSDDWLYPYFLDTIMPYMIDNPNCVFGYGEIEAVEFEKLDKVLYAFRNYRMPTRVLSAKESFRHSVTLQDNGWFTGDIIRREAYGKAGGIMVGDTSYSADFALAFKLHELGDVVYVNKPLGKWRVWTQLEGKVDANRLVPAIEDKVKSYSIVEESPYLLSLLENGRADVEKWKRHYAKEYAFGCLSAYAIDRISPEDLKRSFVAIRRLSNSAKVQLYHLLTKEPFKTGLKTLWRIKKIAEQSPSPNSLQARRSTVI